MTDVFTASNGVTVWENEPQDRYLSLRVGGNEGILLSDGEWQALCEYMRSIEDTRLNRWRSKEWPDYVVYPHEPAFQPGGDYQECRVVDERCGRSWVFGSGVSPASGERDAAREYFAAHPVKKPWHDAKPGEVWAFALTETEYPWGVGDGVDAGKFIYAGGESNVLITDPQITSARRIYPEGTAS